MNEQYEKYSTFFNGCILWFFIFLVICFFCVICSCSRTKTLTKTEYIIDTVIIYHADTIVLKDTVSIWDTAYLENETAIAKSYLNPINNTIVLELSEKTFEIPVKLHVKEKKKEITKQDKKVTINKICGWLTATFIAASLFIMVFNWKKR